MALARIDSGIILVLIATRLEAVISDADMLKRYPGEEQPVDAAVPWAHLFALDVRQIPRSQGAGEIAGGDVPDTARLIAAFTVAVPDSLTRTTLKSLPAAVTRLRAALDGATLEDEGHRVQFVRADESYDPVPDDAQSIRTAGVVFSAIVTRSWGNTVTT